MLVDLLDAIAKLGDQEAEVKQLEEEKKIEEMYKEILKKVENIFIDAGKEVLREGYEFYLYFNLYPIVNSYGYSQPYVYFKDKNGMEIDRLINSLLSEKTSQEFLQRLQQEGIEVEEQEQENINQKELTRFVIRYHRVRKDNMILEQY